MELSVVKQLWGNLATTRADLSQSCLLVIQLCPTLYNPMDCSPAGSSVHGISQVRILEWVAIPFSRGPPCTRGQTRDSCIAGRFYILWAIKEVLPGGRLTPAWVESRLSSVFTCPSISPVCPGEGGVSSMYSTRGLSHSVCSLTHSLPSVAVCPFRSVFSFETPPRGKGMNPVTFFLMLPDYVCIFLKTLVILESFCQFPVSFQWEFFHMWMYFWYVCGSTWALCLSSYSPILICFF